MQLRLFGNTGLEVSAVGLGAGQIGENGCDDDAARAVIRTALDSGVTFFDTARSYGRSEERLGRHLSRDENIVRSTKVGYDVPGARDWTAAAVLGGVDLALVRLQVDVIDVVFLHSCPLEVLQQGEVIDALHTARAAGKVRVAGYSGENEALAWAVDSGLFGAVQTSVNLVDQWSLYHVLAPAKAAGLGLVAKRPLANAPWRFSDRPVGQDAELYWERLRALGLRAPGEDWVATALRFASFTPGVSTAIVGTASPAHLREAMSAEARGPLEPEDYEVWRAAFLPYAEQWPGRV